MLTILLIVFSNLVFGQNAISFVDSNATWNVAKTYPNGNIQNPNFAATETKIYGCKGDTLIKGVPWARMFFTPIQISLQH